MNDTTPSYPSLPYPSRASSSPKRKRSLLQWIVIAVGVLMFTGVGLVAAFYLWLMWALSQPGVHMW